MDKYHLPLIIGGVDLRFNELGHSLAVCFTLRPSLRCLHLLLPFLELPEANGCIVELAISQSSDALRVAFGLFFVRVIFLLVDVSAVVAF